MSGPQDGGNSSGKPEMSFPNAPSVANIPPDTDQFARISKPAYVATIFIFLAIATLAASARTFLRVYRFRSFKLDDFFLVLAILFMAASTGVVYASKDFTYTQLNVSQGLVRPPDDFTWQMVQFETLDNVSTVTVWASIFSVKFSFVMFFRNLIDRVKGMKVLWWIVVGALTCIVPINMFLGFYICWNFTENLLEFCTNAGMVHREGIYLIVTVVLDIFTDLLVISIPFALLSRVNLSLKRKLALLTVLSLSAFMIVIALIRVTLSPVKSPLAEFMPPGTPTVIPDSVWLFFWQELEACIAVLMVSLTAFRSMLGQESPRSRKGKGAYGNSGSESGKRRSYVTRSEKPRLFERFRKPISSVGAPTVAGEPKSFSAPDEFDRSKISYPVTAPGRIVSVSTTRVEGGLPPLPKTPKWQHHVVAQHRDFEESSREIQMDERYQRSESFV